jgi:hypothetical protein
MVDRGDDAGRLADSKADPLDYCESGISDGQFRFIRAMTTSLRSVGTTPPRNIRTLLIRYHALQADYVRWQICEIIQ